MDFIFLIHSGCIVASHNAMLPKLYIPFQFLPACYVLYRLALKRSNNYSVSHYVIFSTASSLAEPFVRNSLAAIKQVNGCPFRRSESSLVLLLSVCLLFPPLGDKLNSPLACSGLIGPYPWRRKRLCFVSLCIHPYRCRAASSGFGNCV
jgi:hypothetical protein